MKVTDPDVIKIGERDLIDAVKNDLDWDVIKEIVKKRIDLSALESKGGEIVVHNNQIAFRVDLGLTLDVSLMFDRAGNYIPDQDLPEEAVEDLLTATAAADDDLTEPESGLDFQEELLVDNEDALSEEIDQAMEALGLEADGQDVSASETTVSELDLDDASPVDDETADAFETVLEDDELDLNEFSEDESELDLEELSLTDEATEEPIDEDIDDILKESRDFWEQRKDE